MADHSATGATAGHGSDPGGRVLDGLGRVLSRGASGPSRRARRVLDRRPPGHRRRVPTLPEGDRAPDGRRAPARSGGLPGCADPSLLVPGSLVFSKPPGNPSPSTTGRSGGRGPPGASWRHPEGPGSTLDGRDRHPVVHIALRGRRGLFGLGGQGAARPKRSGSTQPRGGLDGATLPMGRRSAAEGQAHGQHLAGRVSVGEPRARRLRGHVTGEGRTRRTAMASTTSSATCGSGPPTGSHRTTPVTPTKSPCCVPRNPRVDLIGRELAPAQTARSSCASSHQRRLAPLRTELLLALSPRRPSRRDDRHVDLAPRVPMRRPRPADNRSSGCLLRLW